MSSQKFSLQLHDRRYEEFNSRLPWETFPGEGQAVCGDKDESASSLSSHFPGLFCKRHPDQSRRSSETLLSFSCFLLIQRQEADHRSVPEQVAEVGGEGRPSD